MHPHVLASHASSTLSLPADSYIYALARASPSLLAATASDDSIRLFSPSTLQADQTILSAHAGITVLRSVAANVIATGGRDGTVKLWDTRTAASPASTFKSPTGAGVLALDANFGSGVVAAGMEGEKTAEVAIWDLRGGGVPKVRYTESHNDDVTVLAFHPCLPLLLSAGADALVNVYNLLAPPASKPGSADDDEDGALRQVVNHGSSVHRAGWIPGGREMWAVSNDEMLSVYRLHDEGEGEAEEKEKEEKEDRREFGDVRGPLGCEYVVDVLDRADGGGAWVVAGSHSGQRVDLCSLAKNGEVMQSWELGGGEGYRLGGAHGEEIVRGILIDETTQSIFTCGEDGLVKAWRPAAGEGALLAAAPAADVPEKRKRDKKEKKKRYNPY